MNKLNDYQKLFMFTEGCTNAGIDNDEFEFNESVSIVEEILSQEEPNESLVDELGGIEVYNKLSETFKEILGDKYDNISETKVTVDIKQTGKEAKARKAKALVMKEVKASDKYKAAKKKFELIVKKLVTGSAKKHGINPSIIDLTKLKV